MKGKQDILPFSNIVLAVNGDINAINIVLIHFERYITRLSQKAVLDRDGNSHIFVEEDIKRSLETKLITAILNFKLN